MSFTLLEFFQGFSGLSIFLLIAGVLLLLVEMFIPGFGVAGVSGLLCLAGSIIARANNFGEALIMTVIVLAVVGIFLLIFLRSATKGALSRSQLILKDELDKESGFMSMEDLDFFIGRKGQTLTVLRPSGLADFDGVKLDVVADSEFIEADVCVCVTSVAGRRIVVKKAAEPAQDTEGEGKC